MASAADKTEKATAKRKLDTRKKGQAAASSELPQSIGLIVSAMLLPTLLPRLFACLGQIWQDAIAPGTITDAEVVTGVFGSLAFEALRVLIPLTAAVTLSSVVAELALSGGRANVYKLKPRWSALNPKNGIKRIVSVQVLWDLGKTVAKLGVLGLVGYTMYESAIEKLLIGPAAFSESVPGMGETLGDLFTRVAAVGIIIGVGDAIFAWRKFDRQQRMTKQEVREEMKQQEANPMVKSEVRRRAQAMSRNRMITAVADADVVITNPTHLAIAIGYDNADEAPRVLAKGAGLIADRIREEARLHSVPIHEDKPIARALYKDVNIGDMIPPTFFAAVAGILASVYRARRR